MVAVRTCAYFALGVGGLAVAVPALLTDLTLGPLALLGLPIGLVGLVVYFLTIWDFVAVGHGTPLPFDPPRSLVRSGFYRAVRNPMALALVVILIGEAVAFSSREILVYAAVSFVAFHLFVVFVEEPGLRRRFGAPYGEYRESVPRWVPRLSALGEAIRDVIRPRGDDRRRAG